MADLSWQLRRTKTFLPTFSVIAKAAGHKQWKKDYAFDIVLGEAKYPSGKKLFVPSTEALVILLVDNCHEKWAAMCKFWAKHGSSANLPKKRTKSERNQAKKGKTTAEDGKTGADDDDDTVGEEDEDLKAQEAEIDKLYKAKYTSQDHGKCKFGTINDEGIEFFNKIGNEISKNRKENKAAIAAFEAKYKKNLCERHNRTSEDAKKTRGKRKRAPGDGPSGPRKKATSVFIDGDSE